MMLSRSWRPRDFSHTEYKTALARCVESATDNLKRFAKEVKRRKTVTGMSTPDRANMHNHCSPRRRLSSLVASLVNVFHGSMLVRALGSVMVVVGSVTTLNLALISPSREKRRCKAGTG